MSIASNISDGTLRTIHLASHTARRPACSFHADDQASLNSLNCEKCLRTRLFGILRFLKSFYNRHAIITFMNLPLNTGLYAVLFLITSPLQRIRLCSLSPSLDHLQITYSSSYLQSFAIVFLFLLGVLFPMSLSVFQHNILLLIKNCLH